MNPARLIGPSENTEADHRPTAKQGHLSLARRDAADALLETLTQAATFLLWTGTVRLAVLIVTGA